MCKRHEQISLIKKEMEGKVFLMYFILFKKLVRKTETNFIDKENRN